MFTLLDWANEMVEREGRDGHILMCKIYSGINEDMPLDYSFKIRKTIKFVVKDIKEEIKYYEEHGWLDFEEDVTDLIRSLNWSIEKLQELLEYLKAHQQ